jgi:hypothetical protein
MRVVVAVLTSALLQLGCQAEIGGDSEEVDGAIIPSPDAALVFDAPPPVPDATPPADAQPCVEGDDRVIDPGTGTCYMIFNTVTNWQTARGLCEQINAHLAVSTSQAENDVFSPLAGLTDVWIGGNDISTEGTWVWLNGEAFGGYTNWRMGEPNNSDANDPAGEDCMIIEGDNGGLWDDRSCLREYGYICER